MEAKKLIGIWMDHSDANLIHLDTEASDDSITSNFNSGLKAEALGRSENLMHNKEQQMHDAFYKTIGTEILKYDHVLLFGPTNAKTELFNHLKKDSHFNDITIDVESSDKMTDNEKHAFVKKHFNK